MAVILLMEPDKLLAQSYSVVLQQAGHQVFWQSNAQTALATLEEQPVGLIILELRLANHNGVEFLHEVRSYPEWDGIPILLHTMVPRSSRGLGKPYWSQLGIVGYLYKPQTNLKQLAAAVANIHAPTLA